MSVRNTVAGALVNLAYKISTVPDDEMNRKEAERILEEHEQ